MTRTSNLNYMTPIPETSVIMTTDLVASCVEILRPGIESFIKSLPPEENRNVIYLVVFDPVYTVHPAKILWQGAIGEQDKNKWRGTYGQNARAKAHLTWRTQKSSHVIQRDQPFLYHQKDFKFGGSVYFNGIVVAASGLSQEQDYMFSAALAGLIHGACMSAMVNELKNSSTPDKYFFPSRT